MKQCNFQTGSAIFTLLEKVAFAVQKLHCLDFFRPHLGAVYLLRWGCYDEGTAAMQPRYTDARATPHMTPTSMDVDSSTC